MSERKWTPGPWRPHKTRTARKVSLEEAQTELRQMIVNHRGHKAPKGQCEYCDRERAAGNGFHPSHDASPRCESGKHSHCSCDTCF